MPFMSLASLFGQLSPRGRKIPRKERTLEKVQAGHGVQNIQESIDTHMEETERQRRLQKQSMFGRGLGKSSIAVQERERLDRLAGRREMALRRSKVEADRGLALVRSRNRQTKRMFPIGIGSQIMQTGAQAFASLGGLGGGS